MRNEIIKECVKALDELVEEDALYAESDGFEGAVRDPSDCVGQLEEMLTEESALSNHSDQYKVIGLSTGHLTKEDSFQLNCASMDVDTNMVMQRDTGFFIKLYEPSDDGIQNTNPAYSETLNKLITAVTKAGFRMIEFDCDADQLDGYPVFDW